MVRISSLIADIDGLLQPTIFRDYGPNGLQVPGVEEVAVVVTGVSAQRELIEKAVTLGAHLVLVHHGLFWEFQAAGLSHRLAERLRPLFVHDINLAAYHLPLDAHPEIGNNALLAAALGCAAHEPFAEHRGAPIGRIGRFEEPVAIADLLDRVRAATGGREPLLQGAGPEAVRRIGIVSGSAADSLDEAVEKGCDAFLTGEPREHVMADAREAGIHFIAAGHYETETHGVRALGDRLAARFGVQHIFVDVPNPV